MSTNFWHLLQLRQANLTKSGRIVADYLADNADKAQYLSISSLAKECNVAEATVFRFCRSLGFDGYHEMRIALAQANVTGSPSAQHLPRSDSSTAALCEHASALFSAAINSTQEVLSPDAVDHAAALLRHAKQVFCFGLGGSMLLASDICARFNGISPKFRTAGDCYLQQMTANLMTPGDVVLFISYSGEAQAAMDILRAAKSSGAGIILMTHYADSPGAALADVVLECAAKDNPLEAGSLSVKAAELYIAEALLLRYTLGPVT